MLATHRRTYDPRTTPTLTDRERDVLRLIATGLSNQEIAEHLALSINTVKTYVRGAYRALGVETRTQAVLWCAEHGYLAGALATDEPGARRQTMMPPPPEPPLEAEDAELVALLREKLRRGDRYVARLAADDETALLRLHHAARDVGVRFGRVGVTVGYLAQNRAVATVGVLP